MGLVGDMVVQTANAPGTGDFILIGPPAGRSSFMTQNGAGQVYYFAEDGTSWEKAIGTVTAGSPDGLSRDTVLGNSLGTTAKINFSGAVTIICDIPAERSLWANAAGDAWLASSRKLSGLAAAADIADAPRLDQVAWQQVGQRIAVGSTSGYSPGVVNITFGVPALARRIKIEWDEVLPTVAGNGMICRISTDGTNYLSGAQDYLQQSSIVNRTTPNISIGDYSYIGVLPSMATVATAAGFIDMYVNDDHAFFTQGRAFVQNGDWWSQSSNGRCNAAAGTRMASVLIGIPGGFARGNVRMTMGM